jgi:hypothetical protein
VLILPQRPALLLPLQPVSRQHLLLVQPALPPLQLQPPQLRLLPWLLSVRLPSLLLRLLLPLLLPLAAAGLAAPLPAVLLSWAAALVGTCVTYMWCVSLMLLQ